MASRPKEDELRSHAIQLLSVNVKQLHIEALDWPDNEKDTDNRSVRISFGHGPYEVEQKQICVGIEAAVNPERDASVAQFSLHVELVGVFGVDEECFDVQYIDQWATQNAPYLLAPYLREHVYGLTLRCGFKPLVLPLLQIPVPPAQDTAPAGPKRPRRQKK